MLWAVLKLKSDADFRVLLVDIYCGLTSAVVAMANSSSSWSSTQSMYLFTDSMSSLGWGSAPIDDLIGTCDSNRFDLFLVIFDLARVTASSFLVR